ncbi:hypothetical protein CUMW_077010 [Citrus unshiu]|nr:hypothetical protein CUMW_077010 [Citrus unshiu]
MEIGTARGCLDKTVSYFSRNLSELGWKNARKVSYPVAAAWNLRTSYQKLAHEHIVSARIRRHHRRSRLLWRAYSMPVSVAADRAEDAEDDSKDSPQRILSQPLSNDELMSLLADSQRKKLMTKLSEANQQNRFLKRQLHIKEDALVDFKSELAVMELEMQCHGKPLMYEAVSMFLHVLGVKALVSLAEEIAQSGIPEGSRKINGKFIQSHLLSRLEAVHEKLKEQIKDVIAVQSKEVPLFWCGMAQSVQVMGTFDGWSQGEHLSPEYNGSFTKFSTTLMLRPGRYEIKFLIDGEWQLSPEFPTVGEGLMKNNLLIVE